MIIFSILLMFFMLFSIMFITLMERKVLGVLNNRKSPNFFLMNSFFQSLMDFIKLLTKKVFKLNFIMKNFWVLMIFFGIMMFIFISLNYPFLNSISYYYMNFFFFFMIYSLMAFFFLLLSYSSNSFFSILSMFRVLIQIISYEVGLMFLFFFPLILMNVFNFYFYFYSMNLIVFFSMIYIFLLIVVALSEMNRLPFDFLESETELVSGFNIEYMSSLFSFIFLIEYGFFLYMMILMNFFFFLNDFFVLMLIFFVIWTRSFLPRFRYDKMLYFFWKEVVILIMYLYI
uniref:NADH-ubiquinone oxidoreductase chain 1 n=1 Tax=Tetranychus truncatus TaxID=93132 RepID=A0A0U1V5K2_9ACAR|nr:NADH dehydrogenase subunit 1 [Tetranychus truncatus]AIM52001.1 NADH dehydrogenase subunit 1 [Tetranychus truncatus]AUT13513.1 NADH dehydrogenase subunit 1 [Tetranychus truncatus]AUT13526.1 NADH dehydrogenase subunit 1 [Tetranychus truncatus]AUT13539.1 NADH dehydrogenase subunit 1 [Tetranychus truncatus]AUT13552.1 NADH dehydrogenase subunit 1 [Tetranychus truncatus]